MPFTGSIGVFQTQLNAVVPFWLCKRTDGVFLVWFADIIQQKLRAMPALAAVGYHHRRRTAVCLTGGVGNGFHTASSGKRQSSTAVFKVRTVDDRTGFRVGCGHGCKGDGCAEQHSTQQSRKNLFACVLFHKCKPP